MKQNLSVIVLSFNTKEITDECLTRLKKAKEYVEKKLDCKTEVIVLDNASEDGSWEMLEQKHSWARLIRSRTNTGFSGGNNLAMKEAKGDFILLLNSDAFLEEETLFKSLQFFKDHPDCDVLGCKLKFKDGRLQPSAGYLPTPISTSLWISGLSLLGVDFYPYHPKDPKFFTKIRQVEWVMGAFMMLKREVYEKTGGFDESIFMYGEEIEWCKRIKDKGFKSYYTPQFSITHLDKASSKFMLEKPLLNEFKGVKRYFEAHYRSSWSFVRQVIRVSLILRIIAFGLMGNKPRVKAYLEGFKLL